MSDEKIQPDRVRACVAKYDRPYPCPSDDADASRWPVGDDDVRKEPL